MLKELSTEELKQQVLKCNRCGICQDVCPTYKMTGNENDVARSRIRLARLVLEGKYDWTEDQELIDHLKGCLLCKACVVDCPSGVPTDLIMIQARNEIHKREGLPLFNKIAYRTVFSHSNRLTVLSKLIRVYQKSFAASLVRKSGFLRLLQNYGKAEELLPQVPRKSLREELDSLLVQVDNPRQKVVYFTGCAVNVFYSRFGKASLNVLQSNGCQVHVPEVFCCGAPHLSGGDFEEAKRLALENINLILDLKPDAIITDCATCSGILKKYGELLADDPLYQVQAATFSALVKDISEYLLDIGLSCSLGTIDGIATFHDPCHLSRGQKLTSPPRDLLNDIPQLQLVEMDNADMCCGGAGSYGVTQPDMSRTILDKKMEYFNKSQASFLVTSCPACAMQLEFGLRRCGSEAKVVHPMELLSMACGK